MVKIVIRRESNTGRNRGNRRPFRVRKKPGGGVSFGASFGGDRITTITPAMAVAGVTQAESSVCTSPEIILGIDAEMIKTTEVEIFDANRKLGVNVGLGVGVSVSAGIDSRGNSGVSFETTIGGNLGVDIGENLSLDIEWGGSLRLGLGRDFGGNGAGGKICDDEGTQSEPGGPSDEIDENTGRGKKGRFGSDTLPDHCRMFFAIEMTISEYTKVEFFNDPKRGYISEETRNYEIERGSGYNEFIFVYKYTQYEKSFKTGESSNYSYTRAYEMSWYPKGDMSSNYTYIFDIPPGDNVQMPSYMQFRYSGKSFATLILVGRPKEFVEVIEVYGTGEPAPVKKYSRINQRYGDLIEANDFYWFPNYDIGYIKNISPMYEYKGGEWVVTGMETYIYNKSSYLKGFSDECGDFHQRISSNNIQEIVISDMNNDDACCGMIRRIYEFLDPESFPAKMPKRITVNADSPNNDTVEIKTLPEWLMYRFDIDDERWGEFEVKVEIDDVNLMTKEKEKEEVRLPNLAESIAEIFGLVMEIAISHKVTQNAVLTCLNEAGLAHAAAFKAGREVSEILDYLGFETIEKYETIKTAFTPEAESFEELLEPHNSKIKIVNQKNPKETLQTALNQIKEIYAIVRAQGTLQVDGNNPEWDILNDLLRLYNSMKTQDDIRKQEAAKAQELLKRDYPDIKIEMNLVDGDNTLRGAL